MHNKHTSKHKSTNDHTQKADNRQQAFHGLLTTHKQTQNKYEIPHHANTNHNRTNYNRLYCGLALLVAPGFGPRLGDCEFAVGLLRLLVNHA